MKLNFRIVQALSTSTMFMYWGVRFITHPYHAHLSMLIMGVVAVALSELGYRAGRKEREDELVKVR
jgi:hypothetical protein